MSSEVARLRALFDELIQLPASQRSAALEEKCKGDHELRRRLEELLATAEDNSPFLSAPTGDISIHLMPLTAEPTTEPAPLTEQTGKLIGRYKLLEKIGEGGFGAVYVAEQKSPIKRRVALKILKLGMDTKAVVARFEAERQALAMMDHPNIAKVYDAGATDIGRPYFVMELVRGIPITEYCDQNNLPPIQRLKLFIDICHAIQHAHQKGIIHRDIKPSNILVTLHDGVPVPKVIDFGIAKATQGELTDKTIYTQFQQFIGTPAYMSPEQAEMSGLDIDTRSDIYSLGVLLYELLTGTTPFDAQELLDAGLDEMRRRIRETDPARPSNRLRTMPDETSTTTAKRRGMDARQLISLLRGDLDWVVMKCLEKNRTRRYESASVLAVDIQRHLSNEPVMARPPSRLYRLEKSIHRNKFTYVAGAVVALALALGIAASSWQAIRATRAQRQAVAARHVAQASQQEAVAAQASETTLRKQAEAQELTARQRAYASDMNLAQQALSKSNLGRAVDLLNRQRPLSGQKDLRGWEWRYLWQQTRSDALFTLCKHTGEIESLAVSPDGQLVAVGLVHEGGIFIYDLPSRSQIAHLVPGDMEVRAAFSPTEPLLAFTSVRVGDSGEAQATWHIWNTATRRMVFESALDSAGWGLAFAKDGRKLVITTVRHVILFAMPKGTTLAKYNREPETQAIPNNDFAATSDLTLAAYGIAKGQISVMNLRNGKVIWTAKVTPAPPNASVTALAFSPDGKTLASANGFSRSDICLWDVATGKQIGRLQGHSSWVSSLVFWPDGKKLASSSSDQTIRVWDLTSRECLDVLRGHRLEVWRLALLPDNKTLISGSKDGEVCLWDTSVAHSRQQRVTIPDHVLIWQFAPDSRSVLILNSGGQVVRRSGNSFQHKKILLDFSHKYHSISGFEFSNDGRLFALGTMDGNIQIWDLSKRTLRQKFKVSTGKVAPFNFLDHGNRLIIWRITDKRCCEWDLAANREIQSWPEVITGNVFAVSPDERLTLRFDSEQQIICRDLQNKTRLNLPLDEVEGVNIDFSPDGKLLAIPSTLGYARVWNTANWHEVATLRGVLNAFYTAAFFPNNQRLVTSIKNPDNELLLWDVNSWQEVFTLEGAEHLMNQVMVSPDDNIISALAEDKTLSVWRAPSWTQIRAAEAKNPPPADSQ